MLDLSGWKIAYNAAEPVRASTLNRFIEKFSVCGFKAQSMFPGYGLAENTLIVSFPDKVRVPLIKNFDIEQLKSNKAVENSDTGNSITIPSCGNITEGQKVIIVNPDNILQCKDGNIGEIWIKGESVALGYWNNEPETTRTFRAYLSDTGEGPFLRTGDLGFLYLDNLYITGRLKDMIIIAGHNHYPQDIEITVEEAHDAIRQGCGAAFSIDHKNVEKLVIVYEMKRKYYKAINQDEIKNVIRDAVFRKHDICVFDIIFIEQSSFPKTSSGKLQRQLSKKQYLDGALLEVKFNDVLT
jgi:acyl-CoA synthetase (AMP-forming)/AMP-acid ligase II